MAKATLTINEVMQQESHDPIWVLNTTKGENRGNVFFGVPNALGKEDGVFVPATWVAVDLTEEVTRKQLIESNSLRKAIKSGALTLISDDEAQKILSQEGAAEEAKRVRQMSIGSASAEVQYGLGKEKDMAEPEDVEGVSNPVKQFTDLMDSNTDGESLNTLRTMGELQLTEYRFVLKKAKSLNYPATGKYAAAQVAALKAAQNEEDEV